MPRYKVVFFKNLLNSDGHTFKCPQQEIWSDAPDADRAVESAKEHFLRQHRVHDWRHAADHVEAQEMQDVGSG